ncbi:MAG: hypothetical protein ABSD02_15935 [Steroidobacteraceae bacterium]
MHGRISNRHAPERIAEKAAVTTRELVNLTDDTHHIHLHPVRFLMRPAIG